MLFSLPPTHKDRCQYQVFRHLKPRSQSPDSYSQIRGSVIDTYESYAKEGFAHLMSNQAEFPYQFEKQFLSKVDLTKGPILVTVESIVRQMAVDWDSPKREKKESTCIIPVPGKPKTASNNTIRSNSHTEGKFIQQTKH